MSKKEEECAYDPMIANTSTEGHKIVRGISVSWLNSLAPAIPMAMNARLAISMAAKIA